MSDFIKKNKSCTVFLIFCFILLAIVVNPFSDKGKLLENLYYIISTLITLGLLFVAYSNLKDIEKSINAKFLYQIDQRWGDDEILKARKILHILILESKMSNEMAYVSNKILSYYKDASYAKEFILIINFIEFMETMGYLIYREKTIKLDQVRNLCGYEVEKFYPIFKPLIKQLRKDLNDDSIFKNFKKMHDNIILEKKSNK